MRIVESPGDAAQDAGRPSSLAGRMEGLVSILSPEGVDLSRSTLHAMVWWEESIAPSLGCAVAASDWRRTPDGPRSASVDAVLDGWSSEGAWTRPEDRPVLSEEMEASSSLVDRGCEWSGLGVAGKGEAPARFLPWYRTMCGFAQGLHVMGGVNPAGFEAAPDFRRMILVDPTYVLDDWEAVGGPGRVRLRPPPDHGPVVPGFRGNGAGYAMARWKEMARIEGTSSGPRAAANDFEAAWLWARLLVGRAADAFPEFGLRGFDSVREALRVDERPMADGTVEADFLMDGVRVASAAWRPGRRTVETRGRNGRTWRSDVEDGRLLRIDVEEDRRRQGIGTYVLRHAQSRGCVHAPDPTPEARRLWERHGRPVGEGAWALERVGWPTCRTIEAPDAAPGPAPSAA